MKFDIKIGQRSMWVLNVHPSNHLLFIYIRRVATHFHRHYIAMQLSLFVVCFVFRIFPLFPTSSTFSPRRPSIEHLNLLPFLHLYFAYFFFHV